jgi:thioredoxin-related protein
MVPAQPAKPARQIYYFGHDESCGYCVVTKRDVFPPLRAMNPPWKIGEEDTDFIKVINWTPELAEQYDVHTLPAYILFLDGEEIGRHTGYINHIKLSKFYYSGEVK